MAPRALLLAGMHGWAIPTGSRTWHAVAAGSSRWRHWSPAPAILAPEPGLPVGGGGRRMAALRWVLASVPPAVLDKEA